jgi:hypothetical protein
MRHLVRGCFFLGSFLALPAFAQQRFEFYQGAREMAMGGAGIATVNDETALLINPAGLGKLRDYILTVADPEVEAGSSTEKILGTKVDAALSPQSLLNDLNKNPDDPFHAKAQMFPSFVVPNFGFGVLGKYQVDAEVLGSKNTYQLDYTNDYAAVVGYNFRLFDGILKIGANARAIDRTQIHTTLPDTSTSLTERGLASEGMGLASDVGVILTAPWVWLPTISAVYRDIGNTSYSAGRGLFEDTSTSPATTDHTMDVAVALFPIVANRIRASWSFEYTDILTVSTEKQQIRRMHTGAELNFGDAFFLRAGLNEGYWTTGLEFDVGHYQIQLTTYGEEVGTYPQRIGERRYDLKFSFRF